MSSNVVLSTKILVFVMHFLVQNVKMKKDNENWAPTDTTNAHIFYLLPLFSLAQSVSLQRTSAAFVECPDFIFVRDVVVERERFARIPLAETSDVWVSVWVEERLARVFVHVSTVGF